MAQWLIGIIGALVLSIGVQTWRLDRVQEKRALDKRTIAAHVKAAKHNAGEIQQCKSVNAANEREAQRQREKAEEAATRAKMLAAQLENQIERIPDEAEEFNDEECRTLDEPLPADFVDWLRDT